MKKYLLQLTILLSIKLFSQDSIVLVKQYNNFFFPTDHHSLCEYSPTQLLHAGMTPGGFGGTNIWQTNGTAVGTNTFLTTTNPISGYNPSAIVKVLGKIFFVNTYNSNKFLYSSDGTPGGTVALCKLGSTTTFQYPEKFIIEPKVANGKLFFAKDSSATGIELWATDGTIGGTSMVKDILPGSFGAVNSAYSAILNNKLYFVANDGTNGDELWVTDGTTANTQMVYDLHTGGNASTYFNADFFIHNNNLYFTATVSGFQYGLYKTDGTIGVMPTLESGNLTLTSQAVVHQNAIYFGATTYTPTIFSPSGDLYSISSSTPNIVSDVTYTVTSDNIKGVKGILGSTNNNLYLAVETQNLGVELWHYSTTTNTVNLLKDIATGTLSGVALSNYTYDNLFTNKKTTIGDKLVFVAQSYSTGVTSGNGSHQEEIWTSDGTITGTNKAITPLILSNFSDYAYTSMKNFNGDVYFYGSFYNSSSSGGTLWKLKTGIINVGVNEYTYKQIPFTLYPNPAKEILNIKLEISNEEKTTISISNIFGEIIGASVVENSNNCSINTANLTSGVYFVTVSNQGKQSTKKLIIE